MICPENGLRHDIHLSGYPLTVKIRVFLLENTINIKYTF